MDGIRSYRNRYLCRFILQFPANKKRLGDNLYRYSLSRFCITLYDFSFPIFILTETFPVHLTFQSNVPFPFWNPH
ncbi:MAG: hypothetical protein ACI4DK_11325, partial [Lachnospiraceae bacterium]